MTETDRPHASGFVLVGGRSRRFGTDKAAFEVHGVPAADRLADRLASVCDAGVFLVGRDQAPWSSYPTIPDSPSGSGPIAGVLTALERSSAEFALIVATDLWGATSEDFGALLGELAGSESSGGVELVCAATRSGAIQPLMAAWRVEPCLEVVRRRIAEQQYSMFGVVEALRTSSVTVENEHLANINTTQDLESYLGLRGSDR